MVLSLVAIQQRQSAATLVGAFDCLTRAFMPATHAMQPTHYRGDDDDVPEGPYHHHSQYHKVSELHGFTGSVHGLTKAILGHDLSLTEFAVGNISTPTSTVALVQQLLDTVKVAPARHMQAKAPPAKH